MVVTFDYQIPIKLTLVVQLSIGTSCLTNIPPLQHVTELGAMIYSDYLCKYFKPRAI